MRTITLVYQDPLDLIWIAAAESLGMHVVRDPDVFASWDGAGTLRIGEASTLDADDCLAQMIFHEICHAAVEGPSGFALPDWGLDITDPTQLPHEKACLRLQAALADRHGLRTMLAATTDFRRYYDNLPQDPLDGSSPTAILARAGWERAVEGPWSTIIEEALKHTAMFARIVGPLAPPNSLWAR